MSHVSQTLNQKHSLIIYSPQFVSLNSTGDRTFPLSFPTQRSIEGLSQQILTPEQLGPAYIAGLQVYPVAGVSAPCIVSVGVQHMGDWGELHFTTHQYLVLLYKPKIGAREFLPETLECRYFQRFLMSHGGLSCLMQLLRSARVSSGFGSLGWAE